MAGWLVLQLSRGAEERCGWMVADDHGAPLATPRVGSLTEAAHEAVGRRLAVLVPSSDVLLTEVELPLQGGVRPQQVVPFALEEQLAADIETLHFAVGVRSDSSLRTPVAVVMRALMRHWLDMLQGAGLTPEVLCSEAALLPENPGHLVALIDGDTLCLKRAAQALPAMPADDIGAALEASLGTALAQEHLFFYATPTDWHRFSSQVEALRGRCASLKIQLLSAGPLPLLAPQLLSGHYINLMSGDFALKLPAGAGWRRWRIAALLAVALFAVHVGGLTLQLLQQHRSERTLDAAISDLAHQALPGDSGRGNVRSRVAARLLDAQSQASGAGLMGALASLANALQGVNGASLQALSYRDGGLDLQLKTNDAASLDRIDQSLRGEGWQADLTSGTPAGGAYQGRIQMRPPDSSPVRHR